MKKVSRFFSSIWRWFKETAWVQVLLIVGLVVGVFLSINPIVTGIRKAVESNKTVTFYKDNRITYDTLVTKVEEQEAGQDNQFIVLFYSDTCAHCEAIQKKVKSFYTKFKDQTLYTINIADEDYIKDENMQILAEQYAPVYNNMASDEKNEKYEKYPIEELIVTPTFTLYRDGFPSKIYLGLDETADGVYQDLMKLLDIDDK